MTTQVIDRRLNGKNKSAVNRQRFLRRFKKQIRKAVSDAIARRGITDIDQGESISIPSKDISEPVFSHGPGGRRENVHPGNTDFVTGDHVARPQGQGGAGGDKASNKGDGEDDFVFELSQEEFLEFFFEGLELPDLVKTKLASIQEKKRVRAGYTQNGQPSNINIIRSLKGALSRRIALRKPRNGEVQEAEKELDRLLLLYPESDPRIIALREQIEDLRKRVRRVPFIDPIDLRYNNRIVLPKPTTQAVMFCLMDVSGSMDQAKKDVAKRFFMLLYLFLKRTYERINVVFIRHHTIALEVDEQDFFYSRETGGTVVSSALELMHQVIADRYPSEDWNIYAAQASDGDNWNDDSPVCRDLLINSIVPLVQYFAYIEINSDVHQNLWHEYIKVKNTHPNFAMQHIDGVADIYPVFRELFKKRLA